MKQANLFGDHNEAARIRYHWETSDRALQTQILRLQAENNRLRNENMKLREIATKWICEAVRRGTA